MNQETERAQGTALSSSALSGGPSGTLAQTLADLVKPVGLIRTDDHRYYWNGRGPLPGVTDCLKVIQKWELARYRENLIESLSIRYGPWLQPGDAIAAVDTERDAAASLGTTVHEWAHVLGGDEKAAEGIVLSDWVIPYLTGYRGFLGWLRASQGHILSAEHSIINLSDGYGGTYDLILVIGDQVWLVDIKTSKGYYPENGLQLAAYGRGQFVALPNDPVQYPMPHIDRYAVLHLRPDQYPDTGWRLVEYPITGRDYIAFLAALDLYQWKGEGRFRKSILQKAIIQGDIETGIRTDPLTTEGSGQDVRPLPDAGDSEQGQADSLRGAS